MCWWKHAPARRGPVSRNHRQFRISQGSARDHGGCLFATTDRGVFCDYYDSDTKDAFVNLRHPAEQSDFLRPHVVYAYGGYYRDADLKIDSMERFLQLASSSHHAMFSIMETCLVDNGFFGARKGSRLMASCIDISLTNCDLYLRLPIDMKTGLGAFTRMLAREFFRVMAFGAAITQMKIIDRDEWRRIIGIYPVSYKGDQRNWQIVQAHNGIT